MKQGRILNAIRAAFGRTIWTPTWGRERPGWLAWNGPESREAGSLTPVSASLPLFFGRPGRHRAPADREADSGATTATVRLRNQDARRGDDRWCTVIVFIPAFEGADGQPPTVPPPRPPPLVNRPRTDGNQGKERREV